MRPSTCHRFIIKSDLIELSVIFKSSCELYSPTTQNDLHVPLNLLFEYPNPFNFKSALFVLRPLNLIELVFSIQPDIRYPPFSTYKILFLAG
uniref:Ovule protein n=1 Tax=Caenorhabditis tropicalis TaxID=1561998 RepID=A0A1I7TKT2_9PELO